MGKTSIQWTQATWNPVRGCRRISPGCENCYAERQAARNLPGMKSPTTGEPFAVMTPSGPRWTGKVELIPHMLEIPLKRKTPTTYFVNSMSDLFHEGLPDEAIDRIFAVMALCPQHTFQVLTKRAERMREYFSDIGYRQEVIGIYAELRSGLDRHYDGAGTTPGYGVTWRLPFPNVWLGASCENQATADARIPLLLETPAAVRFVSAEPLLGPVDLTRYLRPHWTTLPGAHTPPWLEWVIVGGESGPDARPFDITWARTIIAQCAGAGVSCFFKQAGAVPMLDGNAMELRDRKGGDLRELPEDLRIREMPDANVQAMRYR